MRKPYIGVASPPMPEVTYELALREQGYRAITGIDEAGRGCWAGPVVAAAVILETRVYDEPALLAGITDSKAMTAAQRTAGVAWIREYAAGVGVGIVPAFLIDALGIVPATRLAMTIALLALPHPADALLIDAVALTALPIPQQSLIKGDACCLSIAAASVIAKVTRDRLMHTADLAYPGYGFAAHKGYGTARHQRALAALGPCAVHRRTFRPVSLHCYEQ